MRAKTLSRSRWQNNAVNVTGVGGEHDEMIRGGATLTAPR
jgi:hypothetical protein